MKCPAGYVVEIAAGCTASCQSYTVRDPVPPNAPQISVWRAGTPLCVVEYPRPINGRYHFDYYLPTVQRVYIMAGSVLSLAHGPLTRYVKLRYAHAPGIPGMFSSPQRVSAPDMHHGTCVTHVPWCMRRSLTSGFLWSRWRGKRSRHSRRMRYPQFYVAGKRPV